MLGLLAHVFISKLLKAVTAMLLIRAKWQRNQCSLRPEFPAWEAGSQLIMISIKPRWINREPELSSKAGSEGRGSSGLKGLLLRLGMVAASLNLQYGGKQERCKWNLVLAAKARRLNYEYFVCFAIFV